MSKRIEFLGAPIDALTMEETVAEIASRLDRGEFTQHVVINVAKLIHMSTDCELRQAVTGCHLINADGMGIVWGARLLGIRVPERVAGVDLFFRLIELAATRGEPVFLLGAKPDVVERTVQELRLRYPLLNLVDWHHGYFFNDEKLIVERIRKSGASMLFVAISSPLKEQFIARHQSGLGVKFAMGVGGTFDIVAGVTLRAPTWMQRMGLEWLFRLVQEPGRMWKRYLVTNSQFAWMILKAKLKLHKPKPANRNVR